MSKAARAMFAIDKIANHSRRERTQSSRQVRALRPLSRKSTPDPILPVGPKKIDDNDRLPAKSEGPSVGVTM